MRPILRSDIELCVRAVQTSGLDVGAETMKRIIDLADIADRYRKRTGRVHAHFGDGSLGSVARRQNCAAACAVCDDQYCLALVVVAQQILVWHLGKIDQAARNG